MAYIYKITNIINQKVYIGVTTDITRRKQEHFSKLQKGKHINPKLQNAFDKYGNVFSFEVIEECNFEERFDREKYYILKYNSFEEGYNLTLGGDGPGGPQFSGENNPMYGKRGKDSPRYVDNIYQLTLEGSIVGEYESSCLAAEALLEIKITRGCKNDHGAAGHITQVCNSWRKEYYPERFTYKGFQWIRKNDYFSLLQNGYDFSSKRTTTMNRTPILELQNKGILDGNI